MKLLFQKILSFADDKATCSLIILEEKYKVMLDCGINPDFDLSKYRAIAEQLKDVKIVLISHSGLEYSGAYPFLISEIGMNPKLFYTTQPIMRYAPLSIHQQLLNIRIPKYNRVIFNKIYSHFEQMQLIKPLQKKTVDLSEKKQEETASEGENESSIMHNQLSIQFSCYLAGSSLGSLYWKISYGLINIMYLVNYNNYSMNHIAGLDMDNLTTQPTNLLITDGYPRQEVLKKSHLQRELHQLLMVFFERSFPEPNRAKLFNPQSDPQLLLVCNPSELMIEMLFILTKIINQLLENNHCEKVGIIHLSSRFLELVKSQSEYFTKQFKTVLEKMGDYYEQTTSLKNRINVCSIHSAEGILAVPHKNLEVYYIGSEDKRKVRSGKQEAVRHQFQKFNLFAEEEQKKQLRSASKLSLSKIEEKPESMMQIQQEQVEASIKEEIVSPQVKEEQAEISQELLLQQEKTEKKNMTNKYISIVSAIPMFNRNKRQKRQQITELGLRHHVPQNLRNRKFQQNQSLEEKHLLSFEETMLSKKQSKVEVMNISFDLPTTTKTPLKYNELSPSLRNFYLTEYTSSMTMIQLLNPKDIIFVNLPPNSSRLFNQYQTDINSQFPRKVMVYDSNVKKICYLSYSNELLLYKMNYLPETHQKKVQKVKGTIVKESCNIVQIHLECVEDYEISSFRLEQFYSQMNKRSLHCKFTGLGISIQGVYIYRKENQIIMEGQYSEEFFKVRKALYQFLGVR